MWGAPNKGSIHTTKHCRNAYPKTIQNTETCMQRFEYTKFIVNYQINYNNHKNFGHSIFDGANTPHIIASCDGVSSFKNGSNFLTTYTPQ